MNISVAEAKAKFSELIERVEAGEEIVVTRDGKAVATIAAPVDVASSRQSIIGAMKGKVWIADEFDELGPEWDEYAK
ncbi:type II toxin-antitoxin system Phd/YefM family antitoxin [Aminobacter aganoensis]|uniref:Antitoxin n=1 Tax=Aminobacter aganoensis TaxID=83264 RepID=A0A7X0KJE7_9HYPH|nr:type II toxin-antitoxin system prevent-host-death family antitoxin [Aminobacter aganoensis]MBB6353130.1 prevent-host-death family protein [Aminobacter aganoensis]